MQIVYKYLPPERIDYLENQLLRFTQPGDLNDPFEFIPMIVNFDSDHFIENVIVRNHRQHLTETQITKGAQAIKDLCISNPDCLSNLFYEKYLHKANAEIGVFSLSRKWNNSLMWSTYAKVQQGFCVGFDSDHEFFHRQATDCADIGTLKPVSYSTKRLDKVIGNTLDIDITWFFTKSSDWSYEEEMRLIRLLRNSKVVKQEKPYEIFLFEVPHDAIREIVCGISASENLKVKLHDFAKSHNIDFYQGVISRTSYDIERRRL